jgi:hypothetical protein
LLFEKITSPLRPLSEKTGASSFFREQEQRLTNLKLAKFFFAELKLMLTFATHFRQIPGNGNDEMEVH